jgi:hypothetical protein
MRWSRWRTAVQSDVSAAIANLSNALPRRQNRTETDTEAWTAVAGEVVVVELVQPSL